MERGNSADSKSSNSSGDLFNLGPYDEETEEEIQAKQKKLDDKEAKRKELNSLYHNCYFGKQTKVEKAERKIQKRRQKRKHHRQSRKKTRRAFLESMSKEERMVYLAQQKKEQEETEIRVAEGQKEGMRIIIDCAFENQMSIKENKSLAVQINRVYGAVRASKLKWAVWLSNVKGMIRRLVIERKITNQKINFDERALFQILVHEKNIDSEYKKDYPLEAPEGYTKPRENYWNSEFEDPSKWEEVVGDREIVYLSPDADEEIYEFDPNAVYVIGGLVDGSINNLQTRHKAQRLKIRSVKLPLEPFRKKYHSFRPCLNINTVFEIIEKTHKYGDINQAIEECIPDRFKTGRTRATRKAKKGENSEKQVKPDEKVNNA